jgi:hypothetical protein
MDSPAALSQAFKIKAAELRDVVYDDLTPNLKTGLSLLEALSPDMMTRMFREHVAVHSERIKARDADFFLSDATGSDPLIATLKASWPTLDDSKKDQVWAVLPMLCNISKRYVRLADGADK